MLKKLYDKSKLWFAIAWIVAYCILMSVGDALSTEVLGVEKSATLIIALVLSLVIFFFLRKNGLFCTYGLCLPQRSAREMLFDLPILIMLSVNLWFGVKMNYSIPESVLYVLTMLLVGFLEEMIFRGLLFDAMIKDSPGAAIIVSSVTFGIGHIINLINGSGAELLSNILQVIYATAAGFMFVMMYYKSKSLIIPILAHGIFNALSAFSAEAASTPENQILSAILLTLITGSYAVYLAIALQPKSEN